MYIHITIACLLIISRSGDPTTFLDSLFQYLTTLAVKKFPNLQKYIFSLKTIEILQQREEGQLYVKSSTFINFLLLICPYCEFFSSGKPEEEGKL